MPGFDFHLDRQVNDEALRSSLAEAFGVPAATISVVPEVSSQGNVGGQSLLCEARTSGGEFALHVAVYPQDDSLQLPTEREAARALVRALRCRCLVTDDQINPFSWILVDASGEHQVSVEPTALDRNELTLSTHQTSPGHEV